MFSYRTRKVIKSKYIQPLADALAEKSVTFWLDNLEVGWGDSITMAINGGMASSRFVLFSLSQRFLSRRWPEAELSAAFAEQNDTGVKRVLPLILNSSESQIYLTLSSFRV